MAKANTLNTGTYDIRYTTSNGWRVSVHGENSWSDLSATNLGKNKPYQLYFSTDSNKLLFVTASFSAAMTPCTGFYLNAANSDILPDTKSTIANLSNNPQYRTQAIGDIYLNVYERIGEDPKIKINSQNTNNSITLAYDSRAKTWSYTLAGGQPTSFDKNNPPTLSSTATTLTVTVDSTLTGYAAVYSSTADTANVMSASTNYSGQVLTGGAISRATTLSVKPSALTNAASMRVNLFQQLGQTLRVYAK